jgi:hypothetical protein
VHTWGTGVGGEHEVQRLVHTWGTGVGGEHEVQRLMHTWGTGVGGEHGIQRLADAVGVDRVVRDDATGEKQCEIARAVGKHMYSWF